jgi:hypothetical protein
VTVTRSVVPGEWYAVLGDPVLVLLPPAAKARAAGLWELVDEGAGFDEVLDALIRDGLRELPGFVLASAEAGDVKIVIRGEGEAELTTDGGPVTVSGGADTTWVERSVTGVTGLRIRVASGQGAAYDVTSGLLRVASVEQVQERPATPEAASPLPPAAAAAPAAYIPVPAPIPPPLGGPAMERMVPPPAAPTPPTSDTTGDDEETQVGAFAPSHLAGGEEASPVARLIFSSGQVVDVDRAIVIGRSPEARRTADDRSRLVTVPSPHQEISSTHLEIRPGAGADEGSAMATDLGSTNGTVVVQPGQPAADLSPGIAVALQTGAILDLGEGVTVQVTGV